jgi:hypothetical protein
LKATLFGATGMVGQGVLRMSRNPSIEQVLSFVRDRSGRLKSKTASYRILYVFMTPLLPILRRLIPQYITTTEILGRAMLRVAQNGYPKAILERRDINQSALP